MPLGVAANRRIVGNLAYKVDQPSVQLCFRRRTQQQRNSRAVRRHLNRSHRDSFRQVQTGNVDGAAHSLASRIDHHSSIVALRDVDLRCHIPLTIRKRKNQIWLYQLHFKTVGITGTTIPEVIIDADMIDAVCGNLVVQSAIWPSGVIVAPNPTASRVVDVDHSIEFRSQNFTSEQLYRDGLIFLCFKAEKVCVSGLTDEATKCSGQRTDRGLLEAVIGFLLDHIWHVLNPNEVGGRTGSLIIGYH